MIALPSVPRRPLPPTPRQDAAQLLLLARLDPTTDLTAAADVLRDTIAAVGSLVTIGLDWQDRSGPFGWGVDCDGAVVTIAYYTGQDEPVYGDAFISVATVLALCERLLASRDDMDEHVCRVAVEQARAVAKGGR